jgi:hypothetical protein
VARIGKIVALVLALASLVVLAIFGFAVWVFLPLLPAGIVFIICVLYARQQTAITPPKEAETQRDYRKAA